MALTEEQKKRIEENRKRALEIRQQKQAEKERQGDSLGATKVNSTNNTGGFISSAVESEQQKKRKINDGTEETSKAEAASTRHTENKKSKHIQGKSEPEDDEESLEDFEHNASEYITKQEAQKIYCLPQGTLAVCSYTERENPHRKGWSKMKLYSRSEVRRRARKRFGGKDGLIQEREMRKEKRLEKDLEEMKDVFR